MSSRDTEDLKKDPGTYRRNPLYKSLFFLKAAPWEREERMGTQ